MAEHDLEPARRPRDKRKLVITIVAIVLGLLVFAVALDLATASPRLCGSCHEMVPRAQAWTHSGHSEVACVKCHQAPTKWYALPTRLVGRAQLLGRDVSAHVSGNYPDPVETRTVDTKPIQDDVCLQCHDVNRKATSGFRIVIDHAKHAKLNGSCVSCHVRTAHPVATRGKAISLMSQCFTCHGQPDYPKAKTDCRLCHPADYELLPKSHTAAAWKKQEHGKAAKTDPKQCVLCHTTAFCTNCHGTEMPHPAGWAKGATGHGKTAQLNRAVCERCHGNRLDMCTMCHHKAYDPAKGPWVKQHFIDARERGVAQCLECHSSLFCVHCHVQ
ncbi:MAG: NapC/NirT family cytochrome c [Actinomycetes bacterium]